MNPHERVEAAMREEGDRTGVWTLDEVGRLDDEHGDLRDGDRWGPWVWNEDHLTLDYVGGRYAHRPYGVDVERILNADDPDAEAWHWVRHVAGKRWDPPAIRCLVLALREVLRQTRGGDDP